MEKNNYYMPTILIGLLVVIGVSVNYHYSQTEETATVNDEVLERAYQDLVAEREMQSYDSEEDVRKIKIYDQDYTLIDSRVLRPEELPDVEFASLLQKSSLMAEYNNSFVYRIKD